MSTVKAAGWPNFVRPCPVILLVFLASLLAGCQTAADLAPQAPPPLSDKYAAIVVDASNGEVLYENQSEVARYPASLTKMMTLYILFEALRDGQLDETSPLTVSAYAARRPPTKIGFRAGDTVSVEEAVMSLIVKSANDVATVVAENFDGSEEDFARRMTAKARALGMRNTVFRNASGLPDSGQVTTARDMAVLALSLRRDFPERYAYFRNHSFIYRGKRIEGHNDLLQTLPGADGIKTGYIRASGFNVATSVRRNGRSVVAVVMGGENSSSRNEHMARLVEIFLPLAERTN